MELKGMRSWEAGVEGEREEEEIGEKFHQEFIGLCRPLAL